MPPKTLDNVSLSLLSILAQRDCYGYEIMQYARDLPSDAIELRPSVLYPLLRQLEQDGLVEGYWLHFEGEGARKYYRLMDIGRQVLRNDRAEF